MLREDPYASLMETKKMQPRVRLAGADVGAGT